MTIKSASSESSEPDHVLAARQHWMSVLARANLDALEAYWQSLPASPEYRFLRKPEIGMAMVRGRAGGTGGAFNLGEVTVTRCVIGLDEGIQGFAYITGRCRRHAELAAVFDALMQADGERHGPALIQPLHAQWQERREQTSRKAAATKVNFMTMVRESVQ
jgi:alpha-D-ribose 1-methylphosphonate 5-triphosphate synthase subunit PhnG